MNPIPRYPDYFADEDGIIWGTKKSPHYPSDTPHRMATMLRDSGYLYVFLTTPDMRTWRTNPMRRDWVAVHKLVCLAFYGPPPDVYHKWPTHLNGDKSDNRIANLEWGLHSSTRKRHEKLSDLYK